MQTEKEEKMLTIAWSFMALAIVATVILIKDIVAEEQAKKF